MTSVKLWGAFAIWVGVAFGQTIAIPGGTLSVSSLSASGTSFTYSGTLTQAATLSLAASGTVCLQNTVYCTNGAGVVVVAGAGAGVGGTSAFSGTFGTTTRTWTYGSLIMVISGQGAVPVFPANSTNGLGGSSPPTVVATPGGVTLSSLGFANFSAVNPTITFVVADSLFTDNSGSFTLTPQAPPPAPTPAPSTLYAALIGLMMMGTWFLAKRGWRRV